MERLQGLPESKKKIILWTVVVILAVFMGFFWVKGVISTVSKIGGEVQNVKIPQIDTSTMPAVDLQKIESQINSVNQNSTPSK